MNDKIKELLEMAGKTKSVKLDALQIYFDAIKNANQKLMDEGESYSTEFLITELTKLSGLLAALEEEAKLLQGDIKQINALKLNSKSIQAAITVTSVEKDPFALEIEQPKKKSHMN